jgi:hypothetical protein
MVSDSIKSQHNFELIILYISILVSFVMAFGKNKLLSIKSIKFHLIQFISIAFVPIVIWIINLFVNLINYFSAIVDAPQIKKIIFLIENGYCDGCKHEHIQPAGIVLLIIVTSIIGLISTASSYYENIDRYQSLNFDDDDDCTWM